MVSKAYSIIENYGENFMQFQKNTRKHVTILCMCNSLFTSEFKRLNQKKLEVCLKYARKNTRRLYHTGAPDIQNMFQNFEHTQYIN